MRLRHCAMLRDFTSWGVEVVIASIARLPHSLVHFTSASIAARDRALHGHGASLPSAGRARTRAAATRGTRRTAGSRSPRRTPRAGTRSGVRPEPPSGPPLRESDDNGLECDALLGELVLGVS